MSQELPKHLADKYRIYALWFESNYGSRPTSELIMVHVERPVSFATFCESYIFQHEELTIEKTGEKVKTNQIFGIQKISNGNQPHYVLSMAGNLGPV